MSRTRSRSGRRSRRRGRALALPAGLLLVIGTGTALSASMTGVPASSAGQQIQAFPAYSAGPPSYSGPDGAVTVTFTTTPPAGQARARVDTGDPLRPWEDCTSSDGGATWTCPVPGLTLAEATAGTFQWAAVP